LEATVADTGIGIEPAHLANLFQPFHQVDAGKNRRYEGTGLGLYISKRLAELLGGTIRLESEPDKGTRATVTLPLAREAEGAGELKTATG
jgi:signal transduction histidine kinase